MTEFASNGKHRAHRHHHSFDRDAGFTASYMETLLMGPERIEVLSTRPRRLTVL